MHSSAHGGRFSRSLRRSLYKGVDIKHTKTAIMFAVESCVERTQQRSSTPRLGIPTAHNSRRPEAVELPLRPGQARHHEERVAGARSPSTDPVRPGFSQPLTVDFRECPLLVQSVFLFDQALNIFEDGLILGWILHNCFLPCEWDGNVDYLMLRPRQTSVNRCSPIG
ncbi:MAG: hypothetical protein K0S58_1166 [Nitrospira sp.]|jgi:hypothetical protein|nr:hypothetical protein [Nitrospira sp.]